jgi:hypothetical protein
MAQLNNTSLSNDIFDSLLPTYGSRIIAKESNKLPIWNESQQMFITDQYTSAAGNHYYCGIRLCENFVTILHIGLYHNWTYINDVEVYCFGATSNAQAPQSSGSSQGAEATQKMLIGKKELDTFYDEELIRATTEKLLTDYIESQCRLQGQACDRQELASKVKGLVDTSYKSMFNEETTQRLKLIEPLLLKK